MAQPQRKSRQIINLDNAKKATGDKVSRSKSDTVKKIFDDLVADGMPEPEAWERAGRVMSNQPYAAESPVGIMSQDAYDQNPGKAPMTVKAKANGAVATRSRFVKRQEMPQGRGWAKRFARGLIRWREARQLSAKAAADKYGIDQTAWNRVELEARQGQVGKQVDRICTAIKVDVCELIKLGEAEAE